MMNLDAQKTVHMLMLEDLVVDFLLMLNSI